MITSSHFVVINVKRMKPNGSRNLRERELTSCASGWNINSRVAVQPSRPPMSGCRGAGSRPARRAPPSAQASAPATAAAARLFDPLKVRYSACGFGI